MVSRGITVQQVGIACLWKYADDVFSTVAWRALYDASKALVGSVTTIYPAWIF